MPRVPLSVPCSLELISPAYQSWYNIFLSQQNSISRLIGRRNHHPNRAWSSPLSPHTVHQPLCLGACFDHQNGKSMPLCELGDEDITLSDTTIEYKVSSFLYLQNDISKNLLLPNVSTSNVHRNKGDDNVHFGKTLFMASTTSHILPPSLNVCRFRFSRNNFD
jgi:hypothetical protein